jgi:hypothetical protein
MNPIYNKELILHATGCNDITCPTIACKIKYKGKARPITGHDGPERESSSTLSLTVALDWDGCLMPHPSCFTSRKVTWYPL